MSLSGRVWPIHPPLQSGEALTSWITRLALMHYQVPSTFFAKTVTSKPDAWKQDIDVSCHPKILQQLSKKCCQPVTELSSGILKTYRSGFDPYTGPSTALPRWVSPTLIRSHRHHILGWKICPLCLSSSDIVYLKLPWRLMFFTACPIHHVMMADQCLSCGSAISSHKIFPEYFDSFPLDALAHCANCGKDHRDQNIIYASNLELSAVRFCIKTLNAGYCHLGSEWITYSHLFFQGLRLIMKGLLRNKLNLFTKMAVKWLGLNKVPHISKHEELEFLDVKSLRSLIIISYWLIEDWPNRFLSINYEWHLSMQDWILPRDVTPYWFSSIVRKRLHKGKYLL